ncbi:TPA: hypothetical protein DEP58_01650 [Patescibacteria group bacterium]|nr:hypothetical protein [Patescibacteria group bacterium]
MIKLPAETKTFIQSNESDLFGNIAVTRNITFDKKGYLRLSYSVRSALSSAQDADFDEVASFVRSQDHGYLAVTHDQLFNIDEDKILGVLPVQNSDTDVPSGDLQSDAIFSGGLLVVTQDSDVDYYSPTPNTWTDTNITLTATVGSQHVVENFVSLASVAIADVNTVKLYPSPLTATPTLSVTLTILADFYITGIAYFNQNLYIATMNRFGGHAFLYVWNGYGASAQSAYEVDSNIIFDVCVHQDSIVCFTGKGQLLRFNGSGFTQLDALPVFYSDIVISDETNVSMYHNCLKSNGDILYINVSTDANVQKLTNQADGIWCYDSALGFMYHRYALSNSLVSIQSIALASVDTSTNQITVTSAPITGTEVIFNAVSATSPAPLVDGKRYFTIKVDATHIKLALTKTLAVAGTAIDITSQSDGTTSLVFFPNTDFGQSLASSRSVAILPIERDIRYPQYGTDLLYGGSAYNSALSSIYYLGTVTGAVENRGYFITPKIFSQNVTDTFNLVTLKFSKFLSDTDKILIKYRTVDDRRDVIDTTTWLATWASTTTFTTTQVDFADAIVGDEVEFLQGGGSGMVAHITAISLDAGTYTVTIDEAYDYYTAGDKARFVFRNWKKWKTITYGDDNAEQGFISENLGEIGKFIQFKIELRGVQTQIEELSVDNKYHLPAQR